MGSEAALAPGLALSPSAMAAEVHAGKCLANRLLRHRHAYPA